MSRPIVFTGLFSLAYKCLDSLQAINKPSHERKILQSFVQSVVVLVVVAICVIVVVIVVVAAV